MEVAPSEPLSPETGSLSRPRRQQSSRLCRQIVDWRRSTTPKRPRQKASRSVAMRRRYRKMCPRVLSADNNKVPIWSTFCKPSDGLEPSTPSLPWRFPGGTGGHGRALADMFFLQIGVLGCVSNARACPRVPELMYPSRTRALLSVLTTENRERVSPPGTAGRLLELGDQRAFGFGGLGICGSGASRRWAPTRTLGRTSGRSPGGRAGAGSQPR